MAELYVTQEAFDTALNTVIQFLRDSGYTGSLEDGTGISDTVLKPNALLYSLYSQITDKASAYQSLAKAQALKSKLTADEYASAVDGILSNWFITRNDGKPSTGVVRLFFSQPVDFLQISAKEVVGTSNGITLVSSEEYVFTDTDFSSTYNSTLTANTEYYVDVKVQTPENSAGTLAANTEIDGSIADIYFLRMTLVGDLSAGMEKESSDAFISRAQKAITTRELITDRAISTVLLEKYDEILRLYTAGYGKEEQIRDIVDYHDVIVHVGNKADIYVASSLSLNTVTGAVDSAGVLSLPMGSLAMAFPPELHDQTTGEPITYALTANEKAWGASGSEAFSIQTTAAEGTIATASFLGSSLIGDIQAFITTPEQRVSNYDPLVRGMFPVILDFQITILRVSDAQSDSEAIRAAIMSYVSELAKEGRLWVESEMVSAIHASVPNVRKVILPTGCNATLFNPRNSRKITVPVNNSLSLSDFGAGLSVQVSDNTVQMYTSADRITITFA